MVASRAHRGIEEVGGEGIGQQGLVLGRDERAHLVRGRGREAHGGRTGDHQVLEGVEQELRADQVDLEHATGVAHGR